MEKKYVYSKFNYLILFLVYFFYSLWFSGFFFVLSFPFRTQALDFSLVIFAGAFSNDGANIIPQWILVKRLPLKPIVCVGGATFFSPQLTIAFSISLER